MKILASCLQFPEEPVALPCQAQRGISQGRRRAIDDLKSYRKLTAAISFPLAEPLAEWSAFRS
jgi:hypothetical protein